MSKSFLDDELEERVHAHFTERYGAPPDADEVWSAISERLGPRGLPAVGTTLNGASETTHTHGDTWLPLPGEAKPWRRSGQARRPVWRTLAMAASLVLALGVLVAGAFSLAYMLDTRGPQPRAGEPTATSVGLPAPSVQATAQVPEPAGQLIVEIDPYDWNLAGNISGNHEKGVDAAVTYNGKPSAYLKSTSPGVTTDAQLSKLWSVEGYAGKRVRFSAYVRSRDVQNFAGLWLQLDNISERVPFFDGVQNRPIERTSDWQKYSLTAEVPLDATHIAFGLLLYGEGEVWIADARIEMLSQNAPVLIARDSATTIYNPGFEQRMFGWRWTFTHGSTSSEATIDKGEAHSGDASLRMKSDTTAPDDQVLLVQTIRVGNYAGKRVRMSAFLKTQDLSNSVVLWLNAIRSDDSGSHFTLSIDNMADRPVRGTTDWQQYNLVLDIPSGATNFDVGAIMSGSGVVWLDDFEIEEVSIDVPATGTGMLTGPSNLGFEEGLAGWGRTGWSPDAYDYTAEALAAYEGKVGARVKSKSPFEGGEKYTLLEQYVDAGQFVEKRVRVTGYVKGVEVSGVAGLFLRTYGAGGRQSVVDLSRVQGMTVTGASDWRKYDVVMDVPGDSYAISYGLSITGEGEVWLDAFTVEVVGSDVPITAPPEPLAP